MRNRPNVEARPKEIIDGWLSEMDLRDPAVTTKAYNTALGRLAANDDVPIEQVRTGYYVYAVEDSSGSQTSLPETGQPLQDEEETP